MKYYIVENKLTEDGSYNARVLVGKTYNENELIDEILETRNIVSKPDLKGVFAAMRETIIRIVKQGNGLNLSWLKLGYSMKGNFATFDAVRDPDRHPLEISVNAGAEITDVLPKVELERITVPDFGPRVLRFYDAGSRTTSKQATPGKMFNIVGERLRIGGRRSDTVGLYLRGQDGAETKVDELLRNEPKYVSGQLPDNLAPGVYKLVVKTQLGANGQMLNDVRTSTADFGLTVK